MNLIDHDNQTETIGREKLSVFPDLGLSIGIHSTIRDSLKRNDFETIAGFAIKETEGKESFEIADEDTRIFPDGIIIRLKSDKR